jgi:glycine cleavage system H protein
MKELPEDLRFTDTHEWVRDNGDGTVAIGITQHAQELLGDLVYVECPQIGLRVTADQACGVVESVKSASDLYAPLAGEVAAINESLKEAPEQINADPYGEGWIYQLVLDNVADMETLMDASAYQELLDSQES